MREYGQSQLLVQAGHGLPWNLDDFWRPYTISRPKQTSPLIWKPKQKAQEETGQIAALHASVSASSLQTTT